VPGRVVASPGDVPILLNHEESETLNRMESDATPPGGPADLTPDTAREALRALEVDRAALAERVRSPWWYHLVLGVIVAAFAASPAVESTSTRSMLVTFACVGLVFLVLAYRRVTGFSVSRAAGPRSRARVVAVLVAVALLFLASMVLAATGAVAWVLAVAAAAFLAVLVGGRDYDRVYGEELRRGR
jgi:hypothetical protein